MKALSKELGKLCALCHEISKATEHDVFVEYAPHVNTFCARAYEGGWAAKKDVAYLTSVGGDKVTFRNINAVRQKLQKYKKAPTGMAVPSVGACEKNQLQDTNYEQDCQWKI